MEGKQSMKEKLLWPPRNYEWRCALEWKLQDFWIGAFWKRQGNCIDLWVCLLPCVPLHISWWWTREPMTRADFLKLPMRKRRKLLQEHCTPEMVHHYEVTCPECGNYYGGHATGGDDVCDCHTAKMLNSDYTTGG